MCRNISKYEQKRKWKPGWNMSWACRGSYCAHSQVSFCFFSPILDHVPHQPPQGIMADTGEEPCSSIFFSVYRGWSKNPQKAKAAARGSSQASSRREIMLFLKWLHCFVAKGKQRTIRDNVSTAWEVAGGGSEHAIRESQHQGVASANQWHPILPSLSLLPLEIWGTVPTSLYFA